MYHEFITYITDAGLSTDEAAQLCALATKRSIRRKEALLQYGDVCRYKAFVIKGLLRTYRTKEDGSEHVIQFSSENNWNVEPESYDTGTPSAYTVDALEASEVLIWTKKDFEALKIQIPRLAAFSQQIISANVHINRQRLFKAISSSAEEKYDDFMQTYPGLLNRLPLHMIASYLGVTRETLSRIRQAQVSR
jgi:CRP-like cAMP-binding protein